MPRIEYRDDGVYLLDRKVEDWTKLERLDGDQWVLKPIRVYRDPDTGEWRSAFGYAVWVEDMEAAGEDATTILGEDRELRWPKSQSEG